MNIVQYIKGHDELSKLDYISVYYTILTLREEGYLLENPDPLHFASER